MEVPNAYTQFVLSSLYSTPQHPEPAQPTWSRSKHSIQVGRINLEPYKATPSKHWSLPSVGVRCYLSTYIKKLGVRIVTPVWGYGNSPHFLTQSGLGMGIAYG